MRIAKAALIFFAAAVPAPLAAQAGSVRAASPPAGWHVRADRADAAVDGIRFVSDNGVLRIAPGRERAIFYSPTVTASGSYRAHATFRQLAELEHNEAYGLILGGKNLDAADQDYLYFLVRQDGKFLVKHRAGAETHTLFDWTAHEAVRTGAATNELSALVGAEGVRFLVNGAEVAKLERVPYLNTDGIVGLRVNHRLEMEVRGFGVAAAPDRP